MDIYIYKCLGLINYNVVCVVFQQMLHDVIALYANLLRGAFLPSYLARLEPRHIGHSESPHTAWKDHKQDVHLAWLPLCVRQVRCVQFYTFISSATNLSLPFDLLNCVLALTS